MVHPLGSISLKATGSIFTQSGDFTGFKVGTTQSLCSSCKLSITILYTREEHNYQPLESIWPNYFQLNWLSPRAITLLYRVT